MIFLLRHGETVWNVTQRKQGRGDSPLTARGRAQVHSSARLLARTVRDPDLVEIHASPLGRARTSAEILRKALGWDRLPILIDDRLAEYDWGLWQGLNTREIDEVFPGERDKREADKWDYIVHGGESYRELATRVRPWLQQRDERRIVVAVTHDIVSRVLRGLYLDLLPETTLRLSHPHETIYVLCEGRVDEIRPPQIPAVHVGGQRASLS